VDGYSYSIAIPSILKKTLIEALYIVQNPWGVLEKE